MSAALVIGAMKAGTTTVYHDLSHLTGVAVGEKESGLYSRGGGVLAPSPDGLTTVDVCADYAMTHVYPEVPARVARDLGTSVRLLYILRDPVERVESHLRHLSSLGEHVDLEDLDEHHHVVMTSRYGHQARQWVEAGHTGLRTIDFHHYSAHRDEGLGRLAEMLDVQVHKLLGPDDGSVQNSSADLRSARPGIRSIVRSPAYRRLKPLIPEAVRERLKRSPLTEGADLGITLPATVVERLTEIFRADLADLRTLVPDPPEWTRNYGGEQR